MTWGGLLLRSGIGIWVAVLGGWVCQRMHAQSPMESGLFARSNLVAWCVVPFDARKRGPEDRARMLLGLGLRRLAYDWRAEHIPTFDEEIRVMRRNGIEITAWWFPGSLDADARTILGALDRNRLKTQLWVTGGGGPVRDAQEQRQRVVAEAARVRPIAEAAAPLGCTVALYNHGGWFGEPENQVEIVKELALGGVTNVGIVYNFHHGHDHIDRFEAMFRLMKPHLLALNLNGMVQGGDRTGKKILHLAEGDRELEMIRVVRSSGWRGPVGILDHRPETDSEITLRNNLAGFDWLLKELNSPGSGGPRPVPAPGEPTKPSAHVPAASRGGDHLEDPAVRSALPIHQVIAAASDAELSRSRGVPEAAAFRTWHRSHGDAAGTRYSGLGEIHRGNVGRLKVAWTYRSGDGKGNIQCNPVVVEGVMFAPTPGDHVVAVDAATGVEKWRFKPGGRPAHRGLVYWPGEGQFHARLLFVAGDRLHALDPVTGRGVAGFGEDGSVRLPGGATAAPAVFDGVVVVPGYERDVWGVDVRRGTLLWTFRTIPGQGEPGSETWDKPGAGANCWGGWPWMWSVGLPISRPVRPSRILWVFTMRGTICMPTAWSPWMRGMVNGSGIFRRSGMISGTSTSPRRPTSFPW